ncbi:T9SS type A sorting domain-containing protein [Hymenobacter sp. BRD67]|uniref:T9SS type A sorting domain-containing protein n=1 Tax=Hymenobacter sp. BRD67 TaxID=2675877 RepID=UPI00156604AA|nr:T9SS type A sorting domain-containing protein [Hymenobacter sp. BRD67]QKG53133.1 T9SS type A sorting domain-containing protein [Hymenobacter sp. BRD67]
MPHGYPTVANTAAAVTNRLICRIAADGTLHTTTRIKDAFSGSASTAGNIRSIASATGSAFYAVGSSNGVVYVPLGNSGNSTSLTAGAPTNLRAVAIAADNLYVSSGSAAATGISQVGKGLPTASPQAVTLLSGFANPAGTTQALLSSASFFFTDQSPAVPGPDVLYVADDGSASGSNGANGGIQKWSLVNNSWVLNGLITGATNPGVRGLAGTTNGTAITLIASSSGSLYAVTDQAGYNAPPSTSVLPAAIATAGTSMAFRGVAPAPLATALTARPEATLTQLALYPSPAQQVVTIRLADGRAGGHTAEVRDLRGRLLRTATLPASGQLSLDGLAAGTYLLTVDGSLTRRISKVD